MQYNTRDNNEKTLRGAGTRQYLFPIALKFQEAGPSYLSATGKGRIENLAVNTNMEI